MSSLGRATEATEELRQALGKMTKRGTVLHLVLDRNGENEDVYFLNTEADRRTIAKIQNGELRLPGLTAGRQSYVEVEEQPDGWRVLRFRENGTCFETRIRLGEPSLSAPLAMGVYRMDGGDGACCDIDWYRLVHAKPDELPAHSFAPISDSYIFDDFVGAC